MFIWLTLTKRTNTYKAHSGNDMVVLASMAAVEAIMAAESHIYALMLS
jgi:hypothetical protein